MIKTDSKYTVVDSINFTDEGLHYDLPCEIVIDKNDLRKETVMKQILKELALYYNWKETKIEV